MYSSSYPLTIHLGKDLYKKIERLGHEQRVSAEDVVISLLNHHLTDGSQDSSLRIIHEDRGAKIRVSDSSAFEEIIRRQDEEITWLREQIIRLSTPQYGVVNDAQRHHMQEECSSHQSSESYEEKNESEPEETGATPRIGIDEFTYNHDIDSESQSGDLLTPPDENLGFGISGRVSGRTIRDSIGGVLEERNYTIGEAAAIAGEPESLILEYIQNGFLPAISENDTQFIRGSDLRRYIMSK